MSTEHKILRKRWYGRDVRVIKMWGWDENGQTGETERADLLGSQMLCQAGPHPPRPLERVPLASVPPATLEQQCVGGVAVGAEAWVVTRSQKLFRRVSETGARTPLWVPGSGLCGL